MNYFWKRFTIFSTLPLILGGIISLIIFKYSAEEIKYPLEEKLQQVSLAKENVQIELDQAQKAVEVFSRFIEFYEAGNQKVAELEKSLDMQIKNGQEVDSLGFLIAADVHSILPPVDTFLFYIPIVKVLHSYHTSRMSQLISRAKAKLVPQSTTSNLDPTIMILELEVNRRQEENQKLREKISKLENSLQACEDSLQKCEDSLKNIKPKESPQASKSTIPTEDVDSTISIDEKLPVIAEKIQLIHNFITDLEEIEKLNGWLMDRKSKVKIAKLLEQWRKQISAFETP